MALFNYIKNKLSTKECPEEGVLKSTTFLQQDSNYRSEFKNWLGSEEQKAMLSLISNNSDRSAPDKAFAILTIPSVCGMTYQYNAKRWEEKEFLFLFDFFAKKLQFLDYKNEAIEIEEWEYPTYKEKIQRAPFTNNNEALNSIMLRLTWRNEQIESFKICACHSKNKSSNHGVQFQKLIKKITT